MLWSRATGTISVSLSGMRKILHYCENFDLDSPFEALGPWPVEDRYGLRLAIALLRASKEPGRNDPNYTQYDSIRKITSSYGNHYEASIRSANNIWVLRSDHYITFFTD